MDNNTREQFGSRLGYILVSAGCAIGIGNVWKFPYICGQYGGAIFMLIYLLFLPRPDHRVCDRPRLSEKCRPRL